MLCAVQAYVALGLVGGFVLLVVVVVIIVVVLYMRRNDSKKSPPPPAKLKEPPDDRISPTNSQQYGAYPGDHLPDFSVQMEQYHEPSYVAYTVLFYPWSSVSCRL